MPRSLSANMASEAAKTENRPVELFQLYLDAQTLFFAAYSEDVSFFDEDGNPVTYYALPLSRGPVKTNMDTKVDEVTVSLGNVSLELGSYFAHADFVGRRMKIVKVFRQKPAPTVEDLEAGTLTQVQVVAGVVVLAALPGEPGSYCPQGTRTSPVYDLSSLGTASASEISFDVTTPEGTSVTVETDFSSDGGSTWRGWTAVASGQEIPGIRRGTDLSNARLRIRQTLRTEDPAATPEVTSCSYVIELSGSLGCSFEDQVTVFDGIMDAPTLNEQVMQVTVVSKLDMLGFRVPRRRYQRPCNWKFGSTECGASLGTVTGTIQGISGDGLTLTLSGRTEAEGYFVDGVLTIGSERQRVLSSNGATIVVDYPFLEAEAGDSYSLRRGCDKSFETCRDRFGNQEAFGGFLSIPAERTIRS